MKATKYTIKELDRMAKKDSCICPVCRKQGKYSNSFLLVTNDKVYLQVDLICKDHGLQELKYVL